METQNKYMYARSDIPYKLKEKCTSQTHTDTDYSLAHFNQNTLSLVINAFPQCTVTLLLISLYRFCSTHY